MFHDLPYCSMAFHKVPCCSTRFHNLPGPSFWFLLSCSWMFCNVPYLSMTFLGLPWPILSLYHFLRLALSILRGLGRSWCRSGEGNVCCGVRVVWMLSFGLITSYLILSPLFILSDCPYLISWSYLPFLFSNWSSGMKGGYGSVIIQNI